MYFLDILRQLQDLRKTWRNQDFHYTREQKEQYEMLVELRRARVAQFYEEGRVSVTKPKSRKVEEEI